MRIASILMTHGRPEATFDTADSIRAWATDDILLVVDKLGVSAFRDRDLHGCRLLEGYAHGRDRSPYRNYALGLKSAHALWPDADWYMYIEYDVLVASDLFKRDLAAAAKGNIYMLGCDRREHKMDYPAFQDILGRGGIDKSVYLLGCCHFLRNDFVTALAGDGFFDRLLDATDKLPVGDFPGYSRHGFEEELWSTAAHKLGGKVQELSCWKGRDWRGDGDRYPVRFQPGIEAGEVHPGASIIHPLKDFDHPVRVHYRKHRERVSRATTRHS